MTHVYSCLAALIIWFNLLIFWIYFYHYFTNFNNFKLKFNLFIIFNSAYINQTTLSRLRCVVMYFPADPLLPITSHHAPHELTSNSDPKCLDKIEDTFSWMPSSRNIWMTSGLSTRQSRHTVIILGIPDSHDFLHKTLLLLRVFPVENSKQKQPEPPSFRATQTERWFWIVCSRGILEKRRVSFTRPNKTHTNHKYEKHKTLCSEVYKVNTIFDKNLNLASLIQKRFVKGQS